MLMHEGDTMLYERAHVSAITITKQFDCFSFSNGTHFNQPSHAHSHTLTYAPSPSPLPPHTHTHIITSSQIKLLKERTSLDPGSTASQTTPTPAESNSDLEQAKAKVKRQYNRIFLILYQKTTPIRIV